MARTVEQIAQEQLGSLMLQLAMITSQLEALTEENTKLKAQVEEKEKGAKEPKKEIS